MGITQIVDLEMAFNLEDWQRRVKNGTNGLRVRCGMYEAHLPAAVEAGHQSGDVLAETEGLVEVGPFKVHFVLSSPAPCSPSICAGHHRRFSRFSDSVLP
jgi:hypothetical protein